MDHISTARDAIGRLLNVSRVEARSLAAILVICIRDRSPVRVDYGGGYSVTASFLHDFEISQMILALQEQRVHVIHFDDELSFMQWVLNGGANALPRPHHLVYTSAVSGIGPGRRTLVPAFCQLYGISTVNSDPYACALNRHKYHWSMLLPRFGLPVPPTWSIDGDGAWFNNERPLAGSLVLGKATFEGSSIGLSTETVGAFGKELEEKFVALARRLKQPITVQELVDGEEYEVPLVATSGDVVALPAARVTRLDGKTLGTEILAYDEVFDDDYVFDARGVPEEMSAMLGAIAVNAASVFPFRGFSRIDFRVSKNAGPFIIDVSSTPHLTKATSFATVFDFLGFSYGEMLLSLFGTKLPR